MCQEEMCANVDLKRRPLFTSYDSIDTDFFPRAAAYLALVCACLLTPNFASLTDEIPSGLEFLETHLNKEINGHCYPNKLAVSSERTASVDLCYV